jgi:secreted trypsin-like serine protease
VFYFPGGPLFYYNPNKQAYTQLGLVAGGVGECGDARFPGIYVRLDHPEIAEFLQSVTNMFPDFGMLSQTIFKE